MSTTPIQKSVGKTIRDVDDTTSINCITITFDDGSVVQFRAEKIGLGHLHLVTINQYDKSP